MSKKRKNLIKWLMRLLKNRNNAPQVNDDSRFHLSDNGEEAHAILVEALKDKMQDFPSSGGVVYIPLGYDETYRRNRHVHFDQHVDSTGRRKLLVVPKERMVPVTLLKVAEMDGNFYFLAELCNEPGRCVVVNGMFTSNKETLGPFSDKIKTAERV